MIPAGANRPAPAEIDMEVYWMTLGDLGIKDGSSLDVELVSDKDEISVLVRDYTSGARSPFKVRVPNYCSILDLKNKITSTRGGQQRLLRCRAGACTWILVAGTPGASEQGRLA